MTSCNILKRPDSSPTFFHGMVAVSPQMTELFARVERVAQADATVLIRGESGTGKELVARAIHACSPRARGPFRAVDCATFTADLIASELFGHLRGAFTGAVRDHPGLFSQADRGTIFLDEIAELPRDIQARLLRVLQERSFVPLGATAPEKVDVRIVSATNRALREEVAAGRFREDLMYRVRVVTLFVPRLRERQGDVGLLTWHFIDAFNRLGGRQVTALAPDAAEAICAYPWPGNVRELRNNIEAAFAVGEGPILRLDELAPELRGIEAGSARPVVAVTLDSLERDRLVEALLRSAGRRAEAAALLGMSRSTLWRKLKQNGLT